MNGKPARIIPLHAAPSDAGEVLERARATALATYQQNLLGTGEAAFVHAQAIASLMTELRLDDDAIAAGWLFAVPSMQADWRDRIGAAFGADVTQLLEGLSNLHKLRDITRAASSGPDAQGQNEILRKMLLAMVSDVRVVLIRLASRVQSLRHAAKLEAHPGHEALARETLDFYAPLANRLGVWQLKWELEDLSFRLLDPETYRAIAAMLASRRVERETYIAGAIGALARELASAGIRAEVIGRPKHIFSIWNKMRQKSLSFEELNDVRALRVLVDDVKDCYAALGVVHNLWQPIPKEFDDYISRPKGNDYRSLHTAVTGPDDLAIEVQIRTHDMHRHAELGVAAHWRYKEAGVSNSAQSVRSAGQFDAKVAYLRQLLNWRDEVAQGSRNGQDGAPSLGVLHTSIRHDADDEFTERGRLREDVQVSSMQQIEDASRIYFHERDGPRAAGERTIPRSTPALHSIR